MCIPIGKDWVKVLRLTPLVIGSILLFSLTDFGLAAAYAKQLYNAPLDESKWNYARDKRWSTAWFVLYSGFLPFLSLTHGTVDAALFFFAQLNPMCTLILSTTFFIGWIIQVSFWFHCDYSPTSNACYQFYVVGSQQSEMSGSLDGVSDGVTGAKVILGMIVLITYAFYLALAAVAFSKMGRRDHVSIDEAQEDQELEGQELEGEEFEDRYSMEYREIISQSLGHRTRVNSLMRGGTGV